MAGVGWARTLLSASPESDRLRRRYARETRRPMHCLLFLIPLVVVFELGAVWSSRGGLTARGLLAQSAISGLLVWFGLVGAWVPPVAFLATLVAWHWLRRDTWRVRAWVFPAMIAESLVLTLPLLVLGAFFLPPRGGPGVGLGRQLLAGLGAAVYEELLFRLLLISALTWLGTQVLRLWRPAARVAAVVCGALIFALCHFDPIGLDPFAWKPFWFRSAAGVYLGAVFVARGLAVSSGCHAAHNLLLVWLRSAAVG